MFMNHNKREVIIETYRKGYEEYIISLLMKCFKSYSKYGLSLKELLELPKRDPSIKLENIFIAFVDGKPAGLIQVVERKIRIIGGAIVDVAGIANVCVVEEYRGLGISSKILDAIHNRYREKKYPLAALLAGYGSIAHSIYLKNKYIDIHSTSSLILSYNDLKILSSMNVNSSKWILEVLNEKYLRNIRGIYDNETSNYTGTIVRDETYWSRKIFGSHPLHTFFYGSINPRFDKVIVSKHDSTPIGYALISSWLNQATLVPQGRVLIKEFYSTGSCIEKIIVLISLIDNIVSELKPKSIVVYSPIIQVFRDVIGLGKILLTDEIYMFKALNVESLVEKIIEGLDLVAQKYGLARGFSIKIGRDYYGSGNILIEASIDGLVKLSFASGIDYLLVNREVTTSNSRLVKLLLQDYKTHIDYIDRW